SLFGPHGETGRLAEREEASVDVAHHEFGRSEQRWFERPDDGHATANALEQCSHILNLDVQNELILDGGVEIGQRCRRIEGAENDFHGSEPQTGPRRISPATNGQQIEPEHMPIELDRALYVGDGYVRDDFEHQRSTEMRS